MSKTFRGAVVLSVVIFATASARADKYFEEFSFSNNLSNPAVVSTSNSNLANIMSDLALGQNTLAPIGANGAVEISPGQPFNLVGTQIPVIVDTFAGTNSAFVAFSASQVPILVNASSPAALAQGLRNVFQKDIRGDWGQEVKKLDSVSPNMPLDGNPQSSQALIATDAFQRFGGQETMSRAALAGNDDFSLRLSLDGGITRAAAIDGNYVDLGLEANKRLDDNFALSFETLLQWRTIGGASSYTFGEIVGMPIIIFPKTNPDNPEDAANYATLADLNYGFPFDLFDGGSWQITPWGVAALGASWDQLMGSVLLGGGGTSSFSLYKGGWSFTLTDQVSYVVGVGLDIGGYNFNVPDHQLLMKNGLSFAWQPGKDGFFADGGFSFTDLFIRAAIPDYWTPFVGVGFRFGPNSGIRVGGTCDWADKYFSYGGNVTFWVTF